MELLTVTPYRRSLVPDPELLPGVRSEVASELCAWGVGSAVPDVTLVLTELLANVHLHASGQVADVLVRPEMSPVAGRPEMCSILVSVSDRSHKLPHLCAPDPFETHGRGMLLVDALSSHWETVLTATGKTIRCHVPVPVHVKQGGRALHPPVTQRTRPSR
ncbi:ATP-binding protein [Streptomyces sp. bgisy100]|uniref:ATP-binding protein n=1 Tax=Streptomyces sp. bgisy100 TaxID=3413783 RepID=UPI003D713CF1